jgi:hypothetical protein
MAKQRFKVHISATAMVHADVTVWAETPQDAEIEAEERASDGKVRWHPADIDDIEAIAEDAL